MNSGNICTVWPDWDILEPPLGRGAYATVYKAVRRDIGGESYAAIKVISIPSDPSEISSLRSEGMDLNSTRKYLKGIVDDFVSEIQLMESLKGIQNIVSVEDYKVVENPDGLGWTIYIRMELLTPFTSYLCDRKLEEAEVIKIAQDLCTALEICKKRNIIHRDIKPENIFVNDFGFFKLGDFGIARTAENMTGSMSQTGTYAYMAPEVTFSSEYTAQVDIYSLGIVLYRLLNNNRLPFLDTEAAVLSPTERQKAIRRRISGEPLPAPCSASREMADVILRACAFKPSDRFESPADMKQALQQVVDGTYVIQDSVPHEDIPEDEAANQTSSESDSAKINPIKKEFQTPDNNKIIKNLPFNLDKKWFIGATAVIAGVAIAIGIHTIRFHSIKNSFLTAVEGTDYDTAAQILDDHEKLMHNDDTLTAISNRISTICTDYRDNKLEYGIAKSNLEGIASLELDGVSSNLTEAFTFLDQLNESRTNHNTADELYESGKYGEAIEHYRLISEIDPDYEDATQKLSAASDLYRDRVLKDASQMVQENEYSDALYTLKEALIILPEDSALTSGYAVTETAYYDYTRSTALEKAAAFGENQEYQEAINELQLALTVVQNDSRLQKELDEYQILLEQQQCDGILAEAATLAESKEYIQAMDILKNAISEGHADPRLQETADAYRTEYISATMAEIETLKKDRKYEEAIAAAKAGLKQIPDCQEFKTAITKLEALKPVSLASVDMFNGDFVWNTGTSKDMFGNNYSNMCNYLQSEKTYSDNGEYFTNLKYRALSMLVAPCERMEEEGHSELKIYIDDELVYSADINQKTDPFEVDIDISNAKYVKIRIINSYTYTSYRKYDNGVLLLANVQLWPAEK